MSLRNFLLSEIRKTLLEQDGDFEIVPADENEQGEIKPGEEVEIEGDDEEDKKSAPAKPSSPKASPASPPPSQGTKGFTKDSPFTPVEFVNWYKKTPIQNKINKRVHIVLEAGSHAVAYTISDINKFNDMYVPIVIGFGKTLNNMTFKDAEISFLKNNFARQQAIQQDDVLFAEKVLFYSLVDPRVYIKLFNPENIPEAAQYGREIPRLSKGEDKVTFNLHEGIFYPTSSKVLSPTDTKKGNTIDDPMPENVFMEWYGLGFLEDRKNNQKAIPWPGYFKNKIKFVKLSKGDLIRKYKFSEDGQIEYRAYYSSKTKEPFLTTKGTFAATCLDRTDVIKDAISDQITKSLSSAQTDQEKKWHEEVQKNLLDPKISLQIVHNVALIFVYRALYAVYGKVDNKIYEEFISRNDARVGAALCNLEPRVIEKIKELITKNPSEFIPAQKAQAPVSGAAPAADSQASGASNRTVTTTTAPGPKTKTLGQLASEKWETEEGSFEKEENGELRESKKFVKNFLLQEIRKALNEQANLPTSLTFSNPYKSELDKENFREGDRPKGTTGIYVTYQNGKRKYGLIKGFKFRYQDPNNLTVITKDPDIIKKYVDKKRRDLRTKEAIGIKCKNAELIQKAVKRHLYDFQPQEQDEEEAYKRLIKRLSDGKMGETTLGVYNLYANDYKLPQQPYTRAGYKAACEADIKKIDEWAEEKAKTLVTNPKCPDGTDPPDKDLNKCKVKCPVKDEQGKEVYVEKGRENQDCPKKCPDNTYPPNNDLSKCPSAKVKCPEKDQQGNDVYVDKGKEEQDCPKKPKASPEPPPTPRRRPRVKRCRDGTPAPDNDLKNCPKEEEEEKPPLDPMQKRCLEDRELQIISTHSRVNFQSIEQAKATFERSWESDRLTGKRRYLFNVGYCPYMQKTPRLFGFSWDPQFPTYGDLDNLEKPDKSDLSYVEAPAPQPKPAAPKPKPVQPAPQAQTPPRPAPAASPPPRPAQSPTEPAVNKEKAASRPKFVRPVQNESKKSNLRDILLREIRAAMK